VTITSGPLEGTNNKDLLPANQNQEFDEDTMNQLLGTGESVAPESEPREAEPEDLEDTEVVQDDPRMISDSPQGAIMSDTTGAGSEVVEDSFEEQGSEQNLQQEIFFQAIPTIIERRIILDRP
jgi:hypothetical protein